MGASKGSNLDYQAQEDEMTATLNNIRRMGYLGTAQATRFIICLAAAF